MQVLNLNQEIPVYHLKPDEVTGNKYFRIYNYKGSLPIDPDMLLPHRKGHYMIAFIRQASGARQWIDMTPYVIKDNAIYFTGPNQIILKEEFKHLWSTGIAFTSEFLSIHDNASLSRLPLIQNPQNGHELLLSLHDIDFIEDILEKMNAEYQNPGEWQQRMLAAHLTVLLTYLSRLYTEQFKAEEPSADKLLLKRYLAKIDDYFREVHEVSEYASQLNISAGHLSEVVKIQSGRPAIKHIHERLIVEARRLLFHTKSTSKEIAFDLGFNDASYFNRFFKRETGVTPAEYRSSIRKMYH